MVRLDARNKLCLPIPSAQINCSGIVPGIEYCYRMPSSVKCSNVLVFTLLTLNQIKQNHSHNHQEDSHSLPTNSNNVIICVIILLCHHDVEC